MTIQQFLARYALYLQQLKGSELYLGVEGVKDTTNLTLETANCAVLNCPFFSIDLGAEKLESQTFTVSFKGLPSDYFLQTFTFDQIPEFVSTVNLLW